MGKEPKGDGVGNNGSITTNVADLLAAAKKGEEIRAANTETTQKTKPVQAVSPERLEEIKKFGEERLH